MECSICLEELTNQLTLSCNHSFHPECVKKLHRPFCPVCRHPLESTGDLTDRDIRQISNREERFFSSSDCKMMACIAFSLVTVFGLFVGSVFGTAIGLYFMK